MINLPSPPQGNADVIRRYLVQLIEQMNVELNTGFAMQATNAGAALSETQDALQQEIQGRWSATQKLIENTGGDVSALEQRVQALENAETTLAARVTALETLITNLGIKFDQTDQVAVLDNWTEARRMFVFNNDGGSGNFLVIGQTTLYESDLRNLLGLPPL